MSKERLVFIDVARGILILLVVLGHIDFHYSKYIFWFHMPAFFILSGMVLPDIIDNRVLRWEGFKTKAIKFFVPYTSYFILITAISYILIPDSLSSDLFLRFFFGGKLLVSVYGTFWFITCLFISQYLFFIIESWRLQPVYLTLLLVGFYFIGVYAPNELGVKFIPFNTNISLVAVSYLFVGYFLKQVSLFENLRWRLLLLFLSGVLMLLFLLVDLYVKRGFYVLDMKYGQFNNVVLDLIIPVVFSMGILVFSLYLSKIKLLSIALSFIGRNTLHIMYLHLLVIASLKAMGVELIWVQIILGSLVPALLAFLFNQNKVTSFLFSGSSVKAK